jgi:hypothetical protein
VGVSLGYYTISDVTEESRSAINAEAKQLNQEREWWCEGIILFDVPGGGKAIFGDTKLCLPGYSTPDGGYLEVHPDDDIFMALRDATFIIHTLADWALRFGVEWRLTIAGDEIGLVTREGADESVTKFFDALAEATEKDTSDPETVELIAASLLKKYASRNDLTLPLK